MTAEPLKPGARILVVDDNERLSSRLARAMNDRGYQATAAFSASDARAAMAVQAYDYAVLDLRIGSESGLALLREMLDRLPELQVVMLTGYGSIATAVDAVRLGAVNFLQKPADAAMVLAALAKGGAAPLEMAPDYAPPTLARAEWEHICRVLEDCGGNISKAARLLGMHRRTLQRKLQAYPPKR